MDARPSELDPYPRAERDLGSAVLWDKSLHRSRRRRVRQRDARRNAPRQKGATLAAGAAILASPVLTPLLGAASASSARPGVTKAEVAQKASVSGEKTWLLSYGDTGEAVAAVQTAAADPVRRDLRPADRGRGEGLPALAGAGRDRHRRRQDLVGDLRLQGALLRRRRRVRLEHLGRRVRERRRSAASRRPRAEPVGGPDLEDRVELRDEIEAAESEPSGAEPAPAPEAEALRRPRPRRSRPAAAARPTAGWSRRSTARSPAPFGEDRGDHAHSGTDIAAPTGTTVRAAQCGTVSVSGTESGYGTMVCVQHAGETTTCYAHLSESQRLGERVREGRPEDRRGRLHRQLHRPAHALRGPPERPGHGSGAVPAGRQDRVRASP